MAIAQLEDRLVPAGTITGTVFLDYNANGVFDTTSTIPAAGGGTVATARDVAWTGGAVEVRGYTAANQLAGSTTSGANGVYTLNLTGTGPYRVEFRLPAAVTSGGAGASSASGVRFVLDPNGGTTANINLSVARPQDYSPDNPLLATSTYVFGASDDTRPALDYNGTNLGNRNDQLVLVSFPYNAGNEIRNPTSADPSNSSIAAVTAPSTRVVRLRHADVGSTWGLAYNKADGRLYAATFQKRHTGVGPGGLGAIYRTAAAINGQTVVDSAETFVTLPSSAVGISYRDVDPRFSQLPAAVPANSPADEPYLYDGLYRDGTGAAARDVGWDAVGKLGFGGLDISEDGQFMYVVALGDRRLYRIDLATRAFTGFDLPVPASVTGRTGANPLGDLRPFAVQIHNGQVYVGAVNSAESTYTSDSAADRGDSSALKGYVFRFDPVSGGFVTSGGATATAPVFEFDLNYGRGYVHPGDTGPTPIPAEWLPWSPIYRNLAPDTSSYGIYTQPMLTGIAFDAAGNMTVGLRDRGGDQFGNYTPVDTQYNPADPNAGPVRPRFGISGGDTLRAFVNADGTTWTLESGGTGPGGTPTAGQQAAVAREQALGAAVGADLAQGPGGAEYFYGDFLVPGIYGNSSLAVPDHQEVSVGGVLQLPGFPDVAVTTFDPAQIARRYNAGGVRWYSTTGETAGAAVRAFELYSTTVFGSPPRGVVVNPPPLFAKANGIGDLVAIPDTTREIGNRVWVDVNRNGIQDSNEGGINGVTVELYDAQGSLVATALTAGDGNYYFTTQAAPPLSPLPPAPGKTFGVPLVAGGQYQVRIPLGQPALAAYTLTAGNATLPAGADPSIALDAVDSDAAPNGGFAVIALTAPVFGADHTFDVGFNPVPLSLGDYVWNDRNNNGVWDAGEPGIPNVTVELVDGNGNPVLDILTGQPKVTATNSSGGYLFTDLLPGRYRVRIPVGQTALNGFVSSSGTNTSATGPFEPAAGEPNNGPNNTDHGVTRGNYVVGPLVNLQLGQAPTNDPENPPGGLTDPAANANSDRTQDFGFYQPVSVGDVVWVDANNDGIRQAGEAGLVGVSVQLLDATGNVIASTTTNADGGYLFTHLTEGQYQVRLVRDAALTGYTSSTGRNGSPTGPYEPVTGNPANDRDHGTQSAGFITGPVITAAVGGATVGDAATAPAGLPADPAAPASRYKNQDFGVFQPLQLGDLVWYDRNNNGRFDAGEAPVGGVTVELLDPTNNNAVIATTTTDPNGLYLFTGLTPGRYAVRITPPAGYSSSTGQNGSPTGPYEPVAGSPGNNQDNGTGQPNGTILANPVTLFAPGDTNNPDPSTDGLPNRANLGVDFGLIRILSLGDLVWEDVNNDGVRDAGEPGISGVVVRLLDANGNPVLGLNNTPLTTTTAADGGYLFTNLNPGQYRIEVVTPAGYRTSSGRNGSRTGPYEPAPAGAGNNQDHGTRVDADDPGSIVRGPVVDLQPGTAPTDDLVGPASVVDPAENANSDRTQDFGFYRPLVLGDLVWRDADNNGTRETSEQGIAGVTVTLLDGAGRVVGTTTTDANGNYLFDDLSPGDYVVQIAPPAGLVSSSGTGLTGSRSGPFEPAAQSTVENADKGTDQADGSVRAPRVTLGLPGDTAANPSRNGFGNLTQDFGLYTPVPAPPPASVSGYVYVDNNINGIREPGETPIGGTRVYLDGRADDGTPISRTTLTDAAGFYQFTGLPAGTYVIREEQPAGRFYDGLDTVGTVGGRTVGTGGNDILTAVRLNAGDAGVNYNFGEIQPASVFGYTWFDSNRNSIFDAGEPPIPGVAVTISGTAFPGTPLERPLTAADVPGGLTARTGPTGRYDFPFLPPGTYTLTEVQPADFEDYREQNGDPYGAAPAIANDVFSGITLTPTQIRGPFNFGETLVGASLVPPVSPQVPTDPTKRQFLSSTTATNAANRSAAVVDDLSQPTPGVNAPVMALPLSPKFTTTTGLVGSSVAYLATGAGVGSAPLVRVFDYTTGVEKFRFLAYEQSYTGGVRTAVGDINGDGVPDIVTATGVGGGPRLRALSGVDGSVLLDFFAYESTYTGGLSVAVGDVDGDGFGDIITGTDQGGGPRVSVFSGRTGAAIQNFFAFDPSQRGGVRVAAADFNGDGRADIAATTGTGVPTRVRVFDGATAGNAILDFAPYESSFTGGATIAAGDFNGDGAADIITGADIGGGPRVSVFSGKDLSVVANFFAYESTFTGGVRVSALDITGDGRVEIVTGAGIGGGGRVSIFSGPGIEMVDDFYAIDVTHTGGIFVGGGTVARKDLTRTGLPVVAGQLAVPGTLADLPADFGASVTT